MFLLWIYFFLIFLPLKCVSLTVFHGKCEVISIPRCRSMPYNMTRFPNSLHQLDQMAANRSFQQFEALIATKCSKYLLFFLCAKSVPFCMEGKKLPHPIPPCRSVCQKVMRGCLPVIRRSGGTWPQGHHCSLLPEYSTSMCVTPQSFVKTPVQDSCIRKCKRRSSMNFRKYKQARFDFVLRARLKQKQINGNGSATLRFRILRILSKSRNISSVPIVKHKKVLQVWLNTNCPCVALVTNGVYILAGYQQASGARLVLGDNRWIVKNTRLMSQNILSWQRRLLKHKKRIGNRSRKERKM